jgi:diguanylate cyclase (GGDEF)-like protein
MSTLGFFESDIRLYVFVVVLFHMIYIPILFLVYSKRESFSFKIISILEKIYLPVILIWGSLFTVLVYLDMQDITIYTIIILLIGGLFIIEVNYSRALFTIGWLVFAVLLWCFTTEVAVANGLVFKALIVTILGYIISSMNYRIRLELHLNQEALEEMNDQLKDQVIRDSLTGLYNNGYTFEFLDQAIEKAKYYEKELSLLMIDIDDFKLVNDNHGHLEGDYVIQSVAKSILDATRDFDVVGRYGGEEYIVVLSNTDLERAKQIAKRILKTISETATHFETKVTASIGVAQWDKDTVSGRINS